MKPPRIYALALIAAFPLLTAEADEVTLTPIMDAAVSEASPDTPYPVNSLIVGKYSGQAWESFLQFDLSGVPVNSEITAAELHLTSGNFGSGTTLRVSKPDTGWAEALATWNNRPAATTLADIALTVENTNSAYLALTVPVLEYLQDVARSATPNRGLKLEFPAASSAQFLAFSSREQANPPELVITHTPGPELPDFTANLTALDDRLRAELFRTPEGAPTPFELVWNTKPGVRYRLWESPDLAAWSVVPGYPVEADALGAVHQVPLTPPAHFFKVEALDEQAPEIVSRFPDDGGFGIKRYAAGNGSELEIQLSDVSGIDPASVALTVSGHGTFTYGGVGLTLDPSGLLTLDLGGDTALGGYGAMVNASLTIADVLGNAATYDWSFELEKEVILAEGLFTFGSPSAQRSGQVVPPIPTRMLAERQGAVGPVKANDNGWTLQQVNTDSLVIAYTTSAPVFAIDQYLTNLTPATVDEIFYRKVTSVSDDTVNQRLTLGTVDVPAWEVMVDGSIALNSDDIAFELDSDGNIIRAYAMRAFSASAKLELRPLEVNWSGKSIMGLFTLFGETKASFGLPIASKDPLDNDWEAKLNLKQAKLRLSPTMSISADMGLLDGLRRFRSEARVDVDAVLEPEFEFLAASIEYAMKAEDKTGEPLLKHPFVIPLGTSPLWVTVTPSLRAEVSVSAGLTGSVSIGASGGYGKTMVFDYVKGRNPMLRIEEQASDFYFDLIEPEITLGGTVGAEMKIMPEVDVKLMSAVGFYVNLDPALKADLNAEISTGSLASADVGIVFDGHLNAGLSIIGIDNSLLPSFDPWELFSWEKRWYFPETAGAAPLAILVQPQSQKVQPGGTINLSVQANHSIGVTYEWRHNGRRLYNDSPTLRITNANSTAAGFYQVTLSRAGSEPIVSDVASVTVRGGGLLVEDFEDGTLNSLISPWQKGTFSVQPGIKANSALGGNAYGFGRSTRGSNAFNNYQSSLRINLPGPTYVSRISFRVREEFGDWGSYGRLLVDGVDVAGFATNGTNNTGQPWGPRFEEIMIGQTVQDLELLITDITTDSEIFLDDLVISAE